MDELLIPMCSPPMGSYFMRPRNPPSLKPKFDHLRPKLIDCQENTLLDMTSQRIRKTSESTARWLGELLIREIRTQASREQTGLSQ